MTPFVEDGTIYGFDQPGQLRAVDLKTGKRLWETLEPLSAKKAPVHSGTGFLVKNGTRFWLFTERGELILCKLSREKYEEIGRAKLLEPTGPNTALLTITEGRYHQVRRMFAAVGNHVTALHRDRIGGLALLSPDRINDYRAEAPESPILQRPCLFTITFIV